MSENIVRNRYSSQGIIKYPTQLHLVGHFRILYHDAKKHEYQQDGRTLYRRMHYRSWNYEIAGDELLGIQYNGGAFCGWPEPRRCCCGIHGRELSIFV